MKKLLLFLTPLLILSFVLSCNESKQLLKVEEHYCKPDTAIELYSDSSFFGQITCMQYYKGKIYALDMKRKDVSVFSENFDSIYFISRSGLGPGEISAPYSPLYINNDTLHILDGSGILRFYKDKYVDIMHLLLGDRGRFVYAADKYYVPYPKEKSIFVVATTHVLQNHQYDSLTYAGKPVKFNDATRTIHSNHRIILADSGYLYVLSYNLPIIEKYDIETLELLSTFDLSNIPVIDENLKYIALKSFPPNTYYNSVRDGYISDGKLYLLCNSQIYKKNSVNTAILRLSLYPQIKVLDMLYLNDKKEHTVFCVSQDYIFTFKNQEYITRFKLPKIYE